MQHPILSDEKAFKRIKWAPSERVGAGAFGSGVLEVVAVGGGMIALPDVCGPVGSDVKRDGSSA